MTERGRQSNTFTVTLAEDLSLGPALFAGRLRGEIQALMGAVQLEKAPHLSLHDMWPPSDE